jgi:lipoate-protein ligase A
MEPSKKLWKKVFNTDPPKIKNEIKEKDKVINFLKESFGKTWPNLTLSNYTLDEKDKEIINRLAIDQFKNINHY